VISDSEIDQLLLSFCQQRWLKVARIIGYTLQALEQREPELDDGIADAIDARMAHLVSSGQLEAQGNIKNWRYSEVRIPRAIESDALSNNP
jgi:Protein of unknown function